MSLRYKNSGYWREIVQGGRHHSGACDIAGCCGERRPLTPCTAAGNFVHALQVRKGNAYFDQRLATVRDCTCLWQSCYINIIGETGQASGQLCLLNLQKNTKISQSTWQAIRQRATPANIKQRPDKIIRMEQEGVQNATLQAVVQVKQMYAAPRIKISCVKASAEGKAAVGDEEEARPEGRAYPNPGIWVTIKSKY